MGCLGNLIKIFLGIIMIIIMLIVGYKLIFDPYRPESPNSSWSHRPVAEQTYSNPDDTEYKSEPSIDNINYDVPVQTGPNHDYIMENTFQKPWVSMALDPELETGLVFVIKAFKAVFGQDFSPTIISAHDSFDRHDKWSPHRVGRAVDISLNDLPLKEKRRLVKVLKATLSDDYTLIWENQFIQNEHLHFQYHQ